MIRHVDSPIVDAQISNRLSYGEVIETFFDKPTAPFSIRPSRICNLLLVLCLLRLCDGIERHCGGVNCLGDCCDGCLVWQLSDSRATFRRSSSICIWMPE